MANEQKPEGKKPRSIKLDPSKFTIDDEGQLIVTDPKLADALRAANESDNDHGVGIIITFD